MPKEIQGKLWKLNGVNLCFGYALGTCTSMDAPRCPKGEHVCVEPGCGQRHSWKAHHGVAVRTGESYGAQAPY